MTVRFQREAKDSERDLSIAQWDTRYYPYGEPIARTRCRRILRATGLFVVSAYLPLPVRWRYHLCRPHRETKDCAALPKVCFDGILSDAKWNFVPEPGDTRSRFRRHNGESPRNRAYRIFHFNLFDRTNRDNCFCVRV